MIKLEAATRLLATDDSEGHWFYSMSKEHQDGYIKEHPDSKYAKERIAMQRPKRKAPAPAPTNKPASNPDIRPNKPAKRKGLTKKVKPKGPIRKTLSGIVGESANVVHGARAVMRSLTGKPKPGDGTMMLKAIGAIVGTAGVAAAVGASAPAAFLGYVALKHLAPDAVSKLMRWSQEAIRNRNWEYDDVTDTWHRRADMKEGHLKASTEESELDQLLQIMDLAVASGKIPKEALDKARAEHPDIAKLDKGTP